MNTNIKHDDRGRATLKKKMEKLKVAQENQKNPNRSVIHSYKLSRLTVFSYLIH